MGIFKRSNSFGRYVLIGLWSFLLIMALGWGTVQAQENICAEVTEISQSECLALVTFYENTTDTSWNKRTNWMLTETPCEWYGVTCKDGHVTILALNNNNLTGSLPPAVGDLAYLEILDLAENNLSGTLPAELSQLSQLKWLYLNDNPLAGPLPSSLMNLDNLEILWLHNTTVCQPNNAPLTSWLNNLPDIHLSPVTCSDQATTASVNIAPATQVGCDEVTEIPTEECQALALLYNNTNGPNWSDNTNWVSNNTPCEWYGVTCEDDQVTMLDLAENELSGQLPAQLGNLTALEELRLNGNNLSGNIPAEFGDLSNLTVLNLSDNPLEGPIPGSMAKVSTLTELSIENTTLCQQDNTIFEEWLQNIGTIDGTLETCTETDMQAESTAEDETMADEETSEDETTADMADEETSEDKTTANMADDETSEDETTADMAETPSDSTASDLTIADTTTSESDTVEGDSTTADMAEEPSTSEEAPVRTKGGLEVTIEETPPETTATIPESGGTLPQAGTYGLIGAGLAVILLLGFGAARNRDEE